ncbi:MAG: hypothetical protein KDA41_15525, partial [Planctomycetales bacterium]|nr:hypothetical protein [Planctomycetales bacterium]
MRTFTFAVVFVALIAFVSFAADSDPATGDAAYTLAASDAGGLPTERDALAGTVNPLGGIILLGGETNDGPSADATLVNPDSGEATPLAPIPKARGGLSAGTFQGKVYAIGGRDGDVALKRVDVYDPAVNKWSDGPELPKGVFGAACVSTLKDIYVIGGNGGKRAEGEVYRLEQDKKGKWDWAKLGKLKTARWGHAAVGLPDGRLLIVGGNGDDGPLASCEYFDGKKSSEAPALPEPAADLIAGVIYYPGAEIVALRGLMGPDVQAPLRLNTTLARWEARADWQALARCGAAGISWGGRLIAAGGRDHEGKRLSTVRAFGWNAEWKETLTPKDTGDFKDLRISPDGKQFAWGGTSKRLEIRDLNTLELLRSREQEDSIRSLDWSPDGKRLVVASGSKVLRVHDARTLEVVFEINTDLQAGYHTRWSPRGDLIAVGSDD